MMAPLPIVNLVVMVAPVLLEPLSFQPLRSRALSLLL